MTEARGCQMFLRSSARNPAPSCSSDDSSDDATSFALTFHGSAQSEGSAQSLLPAQAIIGLDLGNEPPPMRAPGGGYRTITPFPPTPTPRPPTSTSTSQKRRRNPPTAPPRQQARGTVSTSSDSFANPFVEDEREARQIISSLKKRAVVEERIHDHPLYRFASIVSTVANIPLGRLLVTDRVSTLPPRPRGYMPGLGEESSDDSAVERRRRQQKNYNTALSVNNSIDLGKIRLSPLMEARTDAWNLVRRDYPALRSAPLDAFMYSETCSNFFARVVGLFIAEGRPQDFAKDSRDNEERMRAVLSNFTYMKHDPGAPLEKQLYYDYDEYDRATGRKFAVAPSRNPRPRLLPNARPSQKRSSLFSLI